MPRLVAGSRMLAGSRTSVDFGRLIVQPYYFHIVFSSNQQLNVLANATNILDGLSGCTMVTRLRINAPHSGQAYFASPVSTLGNNMLTIKNTNDTNQCFRILCEMGGSTHNFNLNNEPSGQKTYDLNQWFSLGMRYTGSAVEVWKDGVKLGSNAVTGSFGTTATNQHWILGTVDADYLFARMWRSSLADATFIDAMCQNYRIGADLDITFIQGSGTPVDSAHGATVTVNNSPTWVANESRTLVT